MTLLCITNVMKKVFWKLSVSITYLIHSLRKILIEALSYQRIMLRVQSMREINVTYKLFHKYSSLNQINDILYFGPQKTDLSK